VDLKRTDHHTHIRNTVLLQAFKGGSETNTVQVLRAFLRVLQAFKGGSETS
jgi:hypothetical protein